MNTIKSLLRRRETRTGLAAWTIVPALFLFFAVTLAVNPADNVDRLELGAAVMDRGVETPQGEMAIGPRILEGLGTQLGIEITPFQDERDLRDAVDAREVAGGLVVPAGSTERLLAGRPIELKVVRTDANDPFANAFTANLASQLSTQLNAQLAALLPGGEASTPARVSVATTTVAEADDFRLPSVIGAMLLPLWVSGLAFSVMISRAGDAVRRTAGIGRTVAAELAIATVAAGVVATVLTVGLWSITAGSEMNVVGLFAFSWLALAAVAFLMIGAIRAVGLEAGVLLGVLALFVQQPVSGASFPATMAPETVRWAEAIAPMRYTVEGIRNLLVGGSTTIDMAVALSVIGAAGLVLAGVGVTRLSVTGRQRSASVQPA